MSDEDRVLFRAAMSDVRLLKTDKRVPAPKKCAQQLIKEAKKSLMQNKIKRHIDDNIDKKRLSFSDLTVPHITAEQPISFSQSGVNCSIFQKLQTGDLTIAASLDLHGRNIEQARALVASFIVRCYKNNKRYIHIVHGKGRCANSKYPALKNQLYHWLPQCPEVIAFQSAFPRHGGTGAVYVLLKVNKSFVSASLAV